PQPVQMVYVQNGLLFFIFSSPLFCRVKNLNITSSTRRMEVEGDNLKIPPLHPGGKLFHDHFW
ncbi:MAG: hypothetical protein WAZ60_02695, partial [Desulfosalsimonadaceae bacterium]